MPATHCDSLRPDLTLLQDPVVLTPFFLVQAVGSTQSVQSMGRRRGAGMGQRCGTAVNERAAESVVRVYRPCFSIPAYDFALMISCGLIHPLQ